MPKPETEQAEILSDAIEHMLAEWEFMMRNQHAGPDPGPLADYLAEKLIEEGLV